MELQQGFFAGAPLLVKLGSPTLQSSNRRIHIPISVPLDVDDFGSMPDWVGTAYQAVHQHFPSVDPGVTQIADITLHFFNKTGDDNLFAMPSAKVPNGELKKFEVLRVGDPEDPEVELHFKAYANYSREFWKWIGEMAGKEVYMAFPKALGEQPAPAAKQEKLPGTAVVDQAPTAEEDEILAGDANLDMDEILTTAAKSPKKSAAKKTAAKKAAPKKSGPKELAAFHGKHIN